MISTLVASWLIFGAGFAASESHNRGHKFDHEVTWFLIAFTVSMIAGPLNLFFHSVTCFGCGQILVLKFFGIKVYENMENHSVSPRRRTHSNSNEIATNKLEVEYIQKEINSTGYTPPLKVDGNLGPETLRAMEKVFWTSKR